MSPASDTPAPADAPNDVLWDVVEEHVSEAAFGLEQFEYALDHPTRTLKELDRYPEGGLIAHIDALALSGRDVRQRVLLPLFRGENEDAELSEMLVAALALVEAGDQEPIWAALASESAATRHVAVRAAALSGRPDFDRGLAARLELNPPAHTRAALLELLAQRALPPPTLFEALQNDDENVVAAATRAAIGGDAKVLLPIIESLLEHPAASVREAALVTALSWNSHKAWLLVQRLAHIANDIQPFAMQLTAAVGGRPHHRQIAEKLADPKLKNAALFALAFSGNAEVLPVLLEHVAGPDAPAAKLAAQAVATISGIDLSLDELAAPPPPDDPDADLPPLEEDDLEADLVPIPEDALPTPKADAIAARVRSLGPSLDPTRRLLHGTPLSLASLIDALETAPLRRRHTLALMLCLRSGAALRIDTRLFTTAQRTKIASLRTLAANVTLRSFANW